MSLKTALFTVVLFLVVLFLFNLLAESSMFFRILASALVALATVYYLQESGVVSDKKSDHGTPQGFSAEDGW